MKLMKTRAKSMSGKGYRLCLACEKRKNRIGNFCADRRGQFFARGASHTGEAPEFRQQRPAPARTHTRDVVERGMEIAHRSRLAVKRHGEPMGLVANLL